VSRWVAVAAIALAGGAMIGWAAELTIYESLGIGGWLRSAALVALAALTPLALAFVLMRGGRLPSFADVLGKREGPALSGAEWIAGLLVVATTVMAVPVALGLVFDPRYKDFPFAALTASVVPIALLALWSRSGDVRRCLAERIAAATLALSAVYIVFNESVANWQSVWLCLLLLLLSLSLVRFRWSQPAQSSG
jgi:hypothetical protein